MPMMGSIPAGAGPEAQIAELFAAAAEDPKQFKQRMRAVADAAKRYETAKAEAIAEQNRAIELSRKAKEAHALADKRRADLDIREAQLKAAGDAMFADKQALQIEAAGTRQATINKTNELEAWEARLQTREAAVKQREDDATAALAVARAAEAEWTAKRDKLMAAME